jgi:hypothetical protein
MDDFVGKDESFVASWLPKEGLDKLVMKMINKQRRREKR